MPTVSILMPAYNASDTIEYAVASVQAQIFQDWELLIIDDGSTDNTLSLAQNIAKRESRIRPLKNSQESGAASARNYGLIHAKGRYVAFLDADDLWVPNKLAFQLELMASKNAALGYSGFIRRRKGKPDELVSVPHSVSYKTLLRGNVICCSTAIYDTEHCGKIPMPLIRRRHDFALWLEILKQYGPAFGHPEILTIHHIHKGSLSSNKVKAVYGTWRMYRDVVGLSPTMSFYCLCRHILNRLSSSKY